MISPAIYSKVHEVSFSKLEPSDKKVLWAKPGTSSISFALFDNGVWQNVGSGGDIPTNVSAFVNDVPYLTPDDIVGLYTFPEGGIPSSDLSSAVQTSLGKADSAIQTETDPTVPSWAKASSKPSYSASEVGAVPTSRTVNGKALSSDVTLSASDVGALPSNTPLFSGSYNDLSDKPTIPTVPTNVSEFNNDAGYLTSHQDISGKEDKVDIVSASGTTLTAEVGKYYTLSSVGTLAITLPTISSGTTKVQTVTFYIAAGSSPAVTFTSTHSIYYSDGFEIAADTTYEVSAAYNGIAWVVASVKIIIPT